jgi:NADH-quinone oxidoreductase subunit E
VVASPAGSPAALSEATRRAIEGEIAKYPEKRGALLAALHLAQREEGYVSREKMDALAEIFEIDSVEVLEVVSFYNMFYDRPQGRHHVYVCTNLPCSLRGARGLLAALEQHLGIEAGETTGDGRVTLGHEECLGACAWAPVLRVGDRYHENLDSAAAKRIVDELE